MSYVQNAEKFILKYLLFLFYCSGNEEKQGIGTTSIPPLP